MKWDKIFCFHWSRWSNFTKKLKIFIWTTPQKLYIYQKWDQSDQWIEKKNSLGTLRIKALIIAAALHPTGLINPMDPKILQWNVEMLRTGFDHRTLVTNKSLTPIVTKTNICGLSICLRRPEILLSTLN